MDSNTKVYENLARRLATRHGFTLVKTRRRDPLALDYGLYRLEHAGTVLLRAKTLDEVHRFLLQASAVSAIEELVVGRDQWRDAANLSACEADSGVGMGELRERIAVVERALRIIKAEHGRAKREFTKVSNKVIELAIAATLANGVKRSEKE